MDVLSVIKILLSGLKRGLASVAVLGMLTISAIAAEKEIAKVNISPAVQEKIQKASPDERKQLEAAISAGNKFIPYHFDGRAYDVGDSGIKGELKFWLKNIRPLINKDMGEWHRSAPSVHYLLTSEGQPDEPASGIASICPKIELVSVTVTGGHPDSSWKEWYPKSFADDSFVFEYRAKIIGNMDSMPNVPRFFQPNENDALETVLISLDKKNKVNQVASQYDSHWTWTPERQIESLTRFISGISAGFSTADDKVRLKKMIQQIKETKTSICKDVSATTNQPSTKE